MAYTILPTCTACGLCLPACPIDAIAAGDPIYVIDQAGCCDFEDCLAVCPVDAIVLSGSPAPPAAAPDRRSAGLGVGTAGGPGSAA